MNAPPIPGQPWREGAEWHIDVRGMMPPGPMVAILRLVHSAAAGETVVAHLDRDPKPLYPELAERGWMAECVPADPGEVRLRLSRDNL